MFIISLELVKKSKILIFLQIKVLFEKSYYSMSMSTSTHGRGRVARERVQGSKCK